MSNLLTPLEREIAGTADGIINVKLAREKFFEKLAPDYHALTGQIMECRILYSCSTCDVINDEAYIVLTLGKRAGSCSGL